MQEKNVFVEIQNNFNNKNNEKIYKNNIYNYKYFEMFYDIFLFININLFFLFKYI